MSSPYTSIMPRYNGTVSIAATSVAGTVTLSTTPEWVLYSQSVATDGLFGVAISGTTSGLVTFTRAASTTAVTISYVAGA